MLASKKIRHLQSPKSLDLVWSIPGRSRYVVGLLEKEDNGSVSLKYLPGTKDYVEAKANGFQPIPSFRRESGKHTENVMKFFMSRITSRTRPDFPLYLSTIGIDPEDGKKLTDFQLLSYGEARLPSDGFFVLNNYSSTEPPIEFVTEISGIQYHDCISKLSNIKPGDSVLVSRDKENLHDNNAVILEHSEGCLGFINRVQAPAVARWIDERREIKGTIFRKNGIPSRPRVFAFIECL